jgi:organic hydroperoxide reductase OsmC/OhrA
MMGTFAAALAKRKIATPYDRYRADVTGLIENVEGVLKITRITVNYTLKIAPEKRSEATECFQEYLTKCPAAQSVIGCIQLDHQLEFQGL